MRSNDNNNRDDFRETYRLEAFSDGVFAIAITLLVLELIQFLHPQNGERLVTSFAHHWQPFVAFIIGFITILVCWVNHHHAMDYIVKVDGGFMWVNGFLLLMVTLTPFPTAIFAEFLQTEGKIAIIAFGINYFLIGVAAYSICAYASNKNLIAKDSRNFFYYVKLMYGYGIIYTFIALGVCFISIPVAIFLYIFLFVAFAFPKAFAKRLMAGKRKKRSADMNR
jgi:uncharacterized membrane protein